MNETLPGKEDTQRILKYIRTAFMASPFVLVLVGHFIGSSNVTPRIPHLELSLSIVAAVLVVVSFTVPPLILRSLLTQSGPDLTEGEVGRAFMLAQIIGFAIRESPAVLGLVVTVMTGEVSWVLVAAFLSLVLMSRPSPSVAQLNEHLPAELRW